MNWSIFVGLGITEEENIMLSSLFILNGSWWRDSLSRMAPGSPWCPVQTTRYFFRFFSIFFSVLSTCLLYFDIFTVPRNGAIPAFFAAVEYLSKLLPKNTTSLFSFFPKSTMDFNLAMWDENVVTIIPAFRFCIVRRVSSNNPLAIFSEGVFPPCGE